MATIRLKRSTGSSAPSSGLTFGEPAFTDGINSLYVWKNNNTAVRVGAEVSTDTTLASNSDNKIASEKAIKTYVDNAVTVAQGGAVTSISGVTGAVVLGAGTGISIAAGTHPNKGITITNTGVQSLTLTATTNGGLAVSGAGTTGALSKNITLDFANLTAVSPAVGDLVPVGDVSDSNNPKDVTIGGILDIINGDVNVDSNGTSSIAAGAIVDADIASNAAITVTKLAAFTISGHTLGNNLSTLTIGTGLGGTSYNGSSAVTITNTGVTQLTAGTGISVSAGTGNVTVTNTGVQSLAGTSNQITVTPSGGTGALTLSLPSALTVPGSLTTTTDLTVGGNLTVNGTTTTVNSTTLTVEDSLVFLAKGNSAADSLDIGIYGMYDSGGNDLYAGFFRDASDSGKFKLFTGLTAAPSNVVDTVATSFTKGTLSANIEGTVNGLSVSTSTGTLTIANGKTLTASNTLTFTGTDGSSVGFGGGGTVVYTSNNLSVFAATTSAQLAGVINDETGTGPLVFSNAPTLVAPVLGVATATSINGFAIQNAAADSTTKGLAAFTTGEFTASSGVISIGTVDGGSY